MVHNIEILLMPPHSSHLCQPLDVGVFSSLKRAMSKEMDMIMRYGVPNIKKFEWLDSYRVARSNALTESNIKSGWSGTGLFPLNRRRVLVRLAESSPEPTERCSTPDTTNLSNPFANMPETPSKMDSGLFRLAHQKLLENIEAGILDTPTKQYVPRLVSWFENCRAKLSIVEHQYMEVTKILKRRKEHSTGKRIALKDQIILTTEDLYSKVNDAENATRVKRQKKEKETNKNTTGGLQNQGDHRSDIEEQIDIPGMVELEIL